MVITRDKDVWVGDSLVSPSMVTVVSVAALIIARHAWGIKRKHKASVTTCAV